MRQAEAEEKAAYEVVVNHEKQYSIWRANRPLPPSWNRAGKRGSKDECLDYIKDLWIDMRRPSLRQKK